MNVEEVTVECSWKIENLDDVRNKILWKENLSELTEETNIENCFAISQADSESGPCTIKFVLKNNRKFAALQILSEVSMMEVYGQYEEYLTTVRGELLDEIEGSSLYECRIDLKKLQSEILLKFCKLKDITSFWIYGISAVTRLVESPQTRSLPEMTGGGVNQFLSSMMLGLNQSGNKPPSNNIELIVDRKIKEMEERMMTRIEERFNCLEKRIEQGHIQIMALLSDQKENK